MSERIEGILLLYHHPLHESAATIMEHVNAFARHSRFPVWAVNTEIGCLAALKEGGLDFDVVVLHYSLFGTDAYRLDEQQYAFLRRTQAYKIAFFQDEMHYCTRRFAFLNHYDVDCVWTLVEPEYWPMVYGKYTRVPKLVHTIPGFASDTLAERAAAFEKPDEERTIDIGYRGRMLPAYLGRGAQEKADIGWQVLRRAETSGLTVDIAVDEESRIYGDDWFRFLGNCKATIGTEAGTSVFDIEDEVRALRDRLIAENPSISRGEILDAIVPWEGRIFYRTVSPRHFEAAALRVVQILFEGRYSGALQPMLHYIPLAKDFSNWDGVIRLWRDPDVRREIAERAYADLVASGVYSYRAFVEHFDRELVDSGLAPAASREVVERVHARLAADELRARRRYMVLRALEHPFPGRRSLVRFLGLRSARRAHRRWRARRATHLDPFARGDAVAQGSVVELDDART
jgi:hypothetical protein